MTTSEVSGSRPKTLDVKKDLAPFFLIAGPCVIESRDHVLFMAGEIQKIAHRLNLPYVFKTSYDKANRLAGSSYRGPGIDEGLRILEEVRRTHGLWVLTDVHETQEVPAVAQGVDILQIPAFLCRQTDLVVAAAKTGKAVNIKKGQFMAPWDMKPIVDKALSTGNPSVFVTERGTCFGYNNLVSDMRSIPLMKEWGVPVIFDATHSAQLPGGRGLSSGGIREMIPYLARAAVVCGCDGLFMEVHDRPEKALSDSATQWLLERLESLLRELLRLREALLQS